MMETFHPDAFDFRRMATQGWSRRATRITHTPVCGRADRTAELSIGAFAFFFRTCDDLQAARTRQLVRTRDRPRKTRIRIALPGISGIAA